MEMTPAKLAFIQGDSKEPTQALSKVAEKNDTTEKTVEISLQPAEAKDGKTTKTRAQRLVSSRPRQSTADAHEVLDQVLVPVTIRLPHRVAQALKRAYLEQRLKYAKPDTQQEIAEEALTDWLAKRDYLE